jgi:hypothetical protein
MSRVDRAKADELFARLADGEGLHREDVVLAFRNRVIGAVDRCLTVENAMWMWYGLAHTWRAFLTGEKLTKLTRKAPSKYVDIEGISRESFASLLFE